MKDDLVITDEGCSPSTSLSLIERVRRQEKEAWQRLVRLYTPLICHWCKLSSLRTADTQEIVQEVFMAVGWGIGKFHRDQGGDTFRGWLRTITKNKIIDNAPPLGGEGVGGSGAHERLQQLASNHPLDQSDANSDAVEKNILYRRAVDLMDLKFEANTKKAFWRLIRGEKAKDVAKDLNMTGAAVHVAKCKVLKYLREEFRGVLDDGSPKGEPTKLL